MLSRTARATLITTAIVSLLALFFLALPTPEATATLDDNASTFPSGAFAITNVRLFDGNDVMEAATVVIRDGRVESVASGLFLVAAPGGHGTEYGMVIPTLADAGEAQEFVRQRVAEGSDYIKIVSEDGEAWGMDVPTLGAEEIAAVVKATHEQGRLAVVHVSTLKAGRDAMNAGADGLVHTFGDRVADDEFVALAKSSGAFVVSTITLLDRLDASDGDNPLAADSFFKPYLSASQMESLSGRFPFSGRHVSHASTALENLRRLHDAGVPILAGTDAPNPGTAHGVSLHAELASFVDAGFTPIDALRSATSLPADRFGLEGRGCIAAGCRADLVLVNGDPTTEIEDSRRIEAIWKNGHSVERRLVTASATNPPLEAHELISDFESGEIEASFGAGWMATNDQMMDGTSTADLSIVGAGAGSSAAALRVTGSIGKGFPFPWAGVIFFPGQAPMQPVDATSRTELVFWVRSDQKELRVMAFAESLGQRPTETRVPASSTCTEVHVPFEELSGLDAAGLRGFAISAGPEPGDFWFEIDNVRLR